LVARLGDRAEDLLVGRLVGVEADDEKGDRQLPLSQKLQHARHDDWQVARQRLPFRIAVRLHVRPLVVEVERDAASGLFGGTVGHAVASASRGTDALAESFRNSSAARSASATVSFTLSV